MSKRAKRPRVRIPADGQGQLLFTFLAPALYTSYQIYLDSGTANESHFRTKLTRQDSLSNNNERYGHKVHLLKMTQKFYQRWKKKKNWRSNLQHWSKWIFTETWWEKPEVTNWKLKRKIPEYPVTHQQVMKISYNDDKPVKSPTSSLPIVMCPGLVLNGA